jgi:hypothetical protein
LPFNGEANSFVEAREKNKIYGVAIRITKGAHRLQKGGEVLKNSSPGRGKSIEFGLYPTAN